MITDKDYGWKELKKELQKLEKKPFTKVGILEGKGSKLYKKSSIKVIDVAVANEFGTATIPARPFMRKTYDENQTQYNRLFKRAYNNIIDGKSTVKISLGKIGLFAENKTKKRLRSGPWTPNAPRTIAKKKSSRPLIDTGQLVNSIVSKTVMNGVASDIN